MIKQQNQKSGQKVKITKRKEEAIRRYKKKIVKIEQEIYLLYYSFPSGVCRLVTIFRRKIIKLLYKFIKPFHLFKYDQINSKLADIEPTNIDQIDNKILLQRVNEYINNSNKIKKTCVVYTAISNNYDTLKIPEYLVDEWDYVCFTDRADFPGNLIWKIIPFNYFDIDPTRTTRYIKTHPHLFFSDYECSIWIDANILIKDDYINRYIHKMTENNELFAAIPHPYRNCTYLEAKICIIDNKDDVNIIKEQIRYYKDAGFPLNYGLIETQVLIRHHNNPVIKKMNIDWWNEIERGSRRDQLSLMYVLYKNDIKYSPLLPKWQSTRNTEHFQYFQHNFNHNDKSSEYFLPDFLSIDYIENRKPFWMTDVSGKMEEGDLYKFHNIPIDIIICVHNALDHVKKCLNSVIDALLPSHRMILIDDGSGPETKDYLSDLYNKLRDKTTYIRHEQAKGYTFSVNTGLKKSQAPFIIVLNSDTIVSKKWSLKLIQTAQSAPNIGIVGPLSNAASWQSLPHITDPHTGKMAINVLPPGKTIEYMNKLCEDYSLYPYFPHVQLINGFCYGINRSVIETIGYFDDQLFPAGYGEEDDYSLRAVKAGFINAIATHCYVYHSKSKSFGLGKRQKLAAIGRIKISNRHGESRVNRAVLSIRENPILKIIRFNISKECNVVLCEAPPIRDLQSIPN